MTMMIICVMAMAIYAGGHFARSMSDLLWTIHQHFEISYDESYYIRHMNFMKAAMTRTTAWMLIVTALAFAALAIFKHYNHKTI